MADTEKFSWPGGARAAVSFSFDDARPSQVDHGMELFDKFPFRATFYISPNALEKRLPLWKQMVQKGHEIGNHSMTHPCSANFAWSRAKAVEDMTLETMEREQLIAANQYIEKTLGVPVRTYAYPCGLTYVGRGEETKSFVPLVAKHFLAGRGFRNEFLNDPLYCDLAHLGGTECDGLSFEALREILDRAAEEGRWVIFAGHEIAPSGKQTTALAELAKTLAYLKDHTHDFWVSTVADAAVFVKKTRPTI